MSVSEAGSGSCATHNRSSCDWVCLLSRDKGHSDMWRGVISFMFLIIHTHSYYEDKCIMFQSCVFEEVLLKSCFFDPSPKRCK